MSTWKYGSWLCVKVREDLYVCVHTACQGVSACTTEIYQVRLFSRKEKKNERYS